MSMLGRKIFESIEAIMIECGIDKTTAHLLAYKIQWSLITILILELLIAIIASEIYSSSLSIWAEGLGISSDYLLFPLWIIIGYPLFLILIFLPILKLRMIIKKSPKP